LTTKVNIVEVVSSFELTPMKKKNDWISKSVEAKQIEERFAYCMD